MTQANFIEKTTNGFNFGVIDRAGCVIEDHGTVPTYEEACLISGIKPRPRPQVPGRCFTREEMRFFARN